MTDAVGPNPEGDPRTPPPPGPAPPGPPSWPEPPAVYPTQLVPITAFPRSYPTAPAPGYPMQPLPSPATQPATRYQPALHGVRAASRTARSTALWVASLFLTPLLILLGAYAVLRSGGLLYRIGFHFGFTSGFHFSVPHQRLAAFVLGLLALVVGVVFSFTLARILRLLPPIRRVIVGLEAMVFVVLIVSLVSTKTI